MASGTLKAKTSKLSRESNSRLPKSLIDKDGIPMQLTVTSSVFDLDTMDEVSLIKVKEHKPAESAKEAMERLGGDADLFLKVINDGLIAQAKNALKSDTNTPWQTTDEDGKVNGTFSGTPANAKAVNGLVLSLAKNVFGYAKENPIETKRAAKESALDMIRSNEMMKNGLKRTAAADTE
jgi:hypothetical protein